jgi:hypothetical protein
LLDGVTAWDVTHISHPISKSRTSPLIQQVQAIKQLLHQWYVHLYPPPDFQWSNS